MISNKTYLKSALKACVNKFNEGVISVFDDDVDKLIFCSGALHEIELSNIAGYKIEILIMNAHDITLYFLLEVLLGKSSVGSVVDASLLFKQYFD